MKRINSSMEFKRRCQWKVGVDGENQELGAGGREAGLEGTQVKVPFTTRRNNIKEILKYF